MLRCPHVPVRLAQPGVNRFVNSGGGSARLERNASRACTPQGCSCEAAGISIHDALVQQAGKWDSRLGEMAYQRPVVMLHAHMLLGLLMAVL